MLHLGDVLSQQNQKRSPRLNLAAEPLDNLGDPGHQRILRTSAGRPERENTRDAASEEALYQLPVAERQRSQALITVKKGLMQSRRYRQSDESDFLVSFPSGSLSAITRVVTAMSTRSCSASC